LIETQTVQQLTHSFYNGKLQAVEQKKTPMHYTIDIGLCCFLIFCVKNAACRQ